MELEQQNLSPPPPTDNNDHLHQMDFNQNPCCNYQNNNMDQAMDFDDDFMDIPDIRDFNIPSIQPTDWTSYEQMNTPPEVATQINEQKPNYEIQQIEPNPKEESGTENHNVELMNTLNKTVSDSEKIMTEGDENIPNEIFDTNGDT